MPVEIDANGGIRPVVGNFDLGGSGAVKPRERFTGDTTGNTIPIFSNR